MTSFPTCEELDAGDKADPYLPRYFSDLRDALAHNNLPDVQRRSKPIKPHKIRRTKATVAMLGIPDNRLSVALEGGRQSPGAVFLVGSPRWLTKQDSKLYLSRGIWFDSELQGHLDTYEPPRLVTYVANFFTLPACSEDERDDGLPIEEGIDTPQSSSCKLEYITNDKLYTRILLANANVAVPITLAYTNHPRVPYPEEGSGHCKVRELPPADTRRAVFEKEIGAFCGRAGSESRSIVVKPSGRMWMGSAGVGIFHNRPLKDLVDHAVDLASRLHEHDALLVEHFAHSIPSQLVITASESILRAATVQSTIGIGSKAADLLKKTVSYLGDEEDLEVPLYAVSGENLGFRLRVLACRNKGGAVTVSKMVAGVAPASKPINGDNTVPCSLDSVLDQWGVSAATKKHLVEAISQEAICAFRAIVTAEATLPPELRGGPAAQTDLLGFDFVITTLRNSIMPVIIEVNDHDCTLAAQILEGILPEESGESIRPWVRTMLWRSDCYMANDKNLVIVGGGGTSKRMTFEACRDLKINVILVDEDPDHFSIKEGFVKHAVILPLYGADIDAAAAAATAKIKALGLELDGVVTFWEDAGPVCAAIRRDLELPGNSVEAQLIAKSKIKTQMTLMDAKTSLSYAVSPHLFATKTARITDPDAADFDQKLAGFSFPAVIKLEFGSSAVGVKLVSSKENARTEIKKLMGDLTEEESHPGCGLSFGNAVIVMEFIGGSEHDVDMLLHRGELICAIVTDNGPTRVPYFAETSAVMPSRIHGDKQGALIDAALNCCRTVGILDGAVNVEFKMTSTGPKLIEINARMGGFYISRWTGPTMNIDWVKCTLMLACGIVPALPKRPRGRRFVAGAQLYSSQHRESLTPAHIEHLKELHKHGRILYSQFEDHLLEVEEYEEPFGNVAVVSDSFEDAKQRLLVTMSSLGLDSGDVPLDYYFANL